MRRIFAVLLLFIFLSGCAAAGPAMQAAFSSESTNVPTQQVPEDAAPTHTVTKNPGLAVDPYDPEDKVPEITENRIIKDYCDAHPSVTMDHVRLRIMGVFEDTCVLFVDVKGMMYAEVITEDNVGGIRFYYSNSQKMQVWHDGRFCSLQEAYGEGLLTQENLQSLSRNYYQEYPYLIPESSQ